MGRSCRFTYKNILFIDLVFYLLKVNSNLTMALTAISIGQEKATHKMSFNQSTQV